MDFGLQHYEGYEHHCHCWQHRARIHSCVSLPIAKYYKLDILTKFFYPFSPPSETGTTTEEEGSESASFPQMGVLTTGLTITLAALLTAPLWVLHMI